MTGHPQKKRSRSTDKDLRLVPPKLDFGLQRRIMVNHAKTFAAADRSDPFAYDRAMCHINNGIASVGLNGEDACYKAEEYREGRELPDGTKYEVIAYKNVQRP